METQDSKKSINLEDFDFDDYITKYVNKSYGLTCLRDAPHFKIHEMCICTEQGLSMDLHEHFGTKPILDSNTFRVVEQAPDKVMSIMKELGHLSFGNGMVLLMRKPNSAKLVGTVIHLCS